MYHTLEHLDPSLHKDLLFDPNGGYEFAREVTVCLLAPHEVPEAAKEYPVVFTQKGPCLPQAVLYAGNGEHPFLSSQGSWLGRYIPLQLRTYPFILGSTEDSDTFNLLVDVQAPHFQSGQGQPLFTSDDQTSELVQRQITLLRNFLNGLRVVNKLLSPWRDKDFFSHDPLLVQDKQEKGLELKGFSTVRPKTLNNLSPEELKNLAQKGLLDLLYAHQHSLTNFGPLLQAAGGILHIQPPSTEEFFADGQSNDPVENS